LDIKKPAQAAEIQSPTGVSGTPVEGHGPSAKKAKQLELKMSQASTREGSQEDPALEKALQKQKVATPHAYTGRMCATSRYLECVKDDSLFDDPLALKLAGDEAKNNPMGEWILVPRTRFGNDFLLRKYKENDCRQLVLLGAGMDARAFRGFRKEIRGSSNRDGAQLSDIQPQPQSILPELHVYEVDQKTNFDVK
jgi:hypothetical protein